MAIKKNENLQTVREFILVLIYFVVQKKIRLKKNIRVQMEKNGIETSRIYFLGLQQFSK